MTTSNRAAVGERRRDYVRAYGSARQRALHRLAKSHPGEYAALLAEERAKEADQ